MDRPIEFRRQMKGYNRDDVNNFISEENIRFNKIEESYQKTIKENEKEITELKQKLNSIDEHLDKIAELEIKISQLESALDSSSSTIVEKDTIIEGLKSAVDSANEKLDMANSIIDDMKKESDKASPAPLPYTENMRVIKEPVYDSSIIEKAEKYDAICEKVDEIFAFAKEEADKIIQEAFEIRKQAAKRSSTHMKNEISERSDSIIDELRRSIRRQFKSTK